MIVLDGPSRPTYPLAIIHPLGPLFRHLPLSLRRHALYLKAHRRIGNFRAPERYTEKVAWRALNDRRAILAVATDKLAGLRYASRFLSADQPKVQMSRNLWVGGDLRELQALSGSLPPRWVLKPNHSSGRVAIVDAPLSASDWSSLHETARRWLVPDEESEVFGNWAYAQARRLLIAQERFGDRAIMPADIKIFCVKGEVVRAFWARGYGSGDFHIASFGPDLATRVRHGHPYELPLDSHTEVDELSPETRHAIIAFAREASEPFDMIRVDGMIEDDRFQFLELTAYPTNGLSGISAESDRTLGGIWNLPDLNAPDPREAEWRELLQGVPKGTLQR